MMPTVNFYADIYISTTAKLNGIKQTLHYRPQLRRANLSIQGEPKILPLKFKMFIYHTHWAWLTALPWNYLKWLLSRPFKKCGPKCQGGGQVYISINLRQNMVPEM